MNSLPSPLFADREEAGRALALRLQRFTRSPDTVVLSIPNGGVPVGAEIARQLELPFDILLVGLITLSACGAKPLGAVTRDGVRMLDCATIDRLHLSNDDINAAILRQCRDLSRRSIFYHGGDPSAEVADRTVILADDGSTPCLTLRSAMRLLRRQHADHVIIAMPGACRHAACDLRMEADEVVTLAETAAASPASGWYRRFPQTTDAEVRQLLHAAHPAAGLGN